MSSIDEASGSLGGNAGHARELASGINGSKDLIDTLAGQLAALGVDTAASQTQAASNRAEELISQANALADALDALRAQVEALKGLAATTSAAGGAKPTLGPTSTPSTTGTLSGPAASTEPTRVGKRHLLNRIGLNSPAKEKNTVVLPNVDTDRDIAAIKSGHARYLRDNLYEVNDRIYGLETPSGTVYPVRGDGFVAMDKLQFTALKGLVAYNGDRAAAEQDPKIARFRRHMTDETWEHARRVFEQGQGRA